MQMKFSIFNVSLSNQSDQGYQTPVFLDSVKVKANTGVIVKQTELSPKIGYGEAEDSANGPYINLKINF